MRLLNPYTLCALIPLIACGLAEAQQSAKKATEPTAQTIAACAGRQVGDTVSFFTKDQQLVGTCENINGHIALSLTQPPAEGFGPLNGHHETEPAPADKTQ